MAYPTTDQQNAQTAYQYFLGKGLSPAQAAGIVGNLTAESNINPESTNSIGCVGIAQWCGGRRNPSLQTGDPTKDLQTQLDYMWYEMTGPEKGSLTALKATTTPADAARAFEATFERSGGALLAQRETYATDFYNLVAGAGGNLQTVLISSNLPGDPKLAPGGIPGLTAPITAGGLGGLASAATAAYTHLTSPQFWLRVGQFVLGFTLLLAGAAFMLNKPATQLVQGVAP